MSVFVLPDWLLAHLQEIEARGEAGDGDVDNLDDVIDIVIFYPQSTNKNLRFIE